jgi:peptidoglycan/LPS O-acetylase OafA/YrhL
LQAEPGSRRSGYIPSLDGWRTLAIVWVLLSHNPVFGIGRFTDAWLHENGERGVQLFFALSGMLICGRLLREEAANGTISLRSFYTRRVFRIQPAALTYLACLTVLTLCGVVRPNWQGIAGAVWMVRNLWPRTFTLETAHFWSLSVEEHFYLLLPGFLVLCRRWRLTLMLAAVAALEVWRNVVYATPGLQGFCWMLYQRTDMAIGGILLGCVFALALTRPRVAEAARACLRPSTALLYMVAAFAAVQWHHSRLEHVLLISVYPVLITATMLHERSWTTRFLELAPMRFVGRISFSLYLWQQLFFLHPAGLRRHAWFCWVASLACAALSYYVVETPLIRLGHTLAGRFDARAAA